jgi:formylglycine-generating enzyme required for sulfatase activity
MIQDGTTNVYRSRLEEVADKLLEVLELEPHHEGTRLRLAEVNMELWRLAVMEDNAAWMGQQRRTVEQYAPDPNPYREELDGFGRIKLSISPADAEAWLYRFETLNAKDSKGRMMASRLVPVPYDPATGSSEKGFARRETRRIAAGDLPEGDRPSVYSFDELPDMKLGAGTLVLDGVPPGSYLILARAPGHAEIRVPFVMPRQGSLKRNIAPPAAAMVPEGFVFIAGGPAGLGGETAGALSQQEYIVPSQLIAREELSMAEYAEFLDHLVRTNQEDRSQARLPRDFGRPLAKLSSDGRLLPIDPAQDSEAFGRSPVRGVSLNDARAYLAWRSERDGRTYRLPEDRAWEVACRGVDERAYSWGDVPGSGLAAVSQGYGDMKGEIAWNWKDNLDESVWGVHNLAGGAAEWTMSPFSPEAQPGDPVFGQYSIRGNAWALQPVGLRCAFRTSGQADYFHPTIGFRLAMDYEG